MSAPAFFPGMSAWPMKTLRRELDLAAMMLADRLSRGSSADSERMAVIQLVTELGSRLQELESLRTAHGRKSQ